MNEKPPTPQVPDIKMRDATPIERIARLERECDQLRSVNLSVYEWGTQIRRAKNGAFLAYCVACIALLVALKALGDSKR